MMTLKHDDLETPITHHFSLFPDFFFLFSDSNLPKASKYGVHVYVIKMIKSIKNKTYLLRAYDMFGPQAWSVFFLSLFEAKNYKSRWRNATNSWSEDIVSTRYVSIAILFPISHREYTTYIDHFTLKTFYSQDLLFSRVYFFIIHEWNPV